MAVQPGKILYAGSSNFAGWHIAQAQAAAARRNLIGLVSEQSLYNLLVRDIELEVIPAAEHYGLGIIPWSPLQGGLLGGVIKKENTGVRRLEGRAAREPRGASGPDPGVRGPGRRARHGTRHVGPRLAAHPARGHRTDHRPANP